MFKSFLPFFSLLVSVIAQDPASFAAFQSAVASYVQGLIQDPTFVQEVDGLATADPALLQSLQAIATQSVNPADLTAVPSVYAQLPSPLNGLFSSVYTHELGLASGYGLLQVASSSSISPTSGFTTITTAASVTSTAISAPTSSTLTPTSTSITFGSTSSTVSSTSILNGNPTQTIGSLEGSTSASPTPSPTSGLSDTTKLGVGLGVGLGGALVIALGAIFFLLKRKSRSAIGYNYGTSEPGVAVDTPDQYAAYPKHG